MNMYQGVDNLELLQKGAKNYNTFLINVVTKTALRIKANKIADFGSGTAFFASQISQKLSSKIHCIEISENLFSFYKNKPDLILHKSLSELGNNSLNLIYSFNVLEHIENDTDYINLIYKKLENNGTLILYLPAFMCLYSSMDKKIGHYRRYNKKDLIAKLEKYFHIQKCCYVDSSGFYVTLLYKIIGNKNGDINPITLYIFDRFIFPLGRLFDILTFGKNILCIATKKIFSPVK